MKKTLMFLVALAALVLVSCSDSAPYVDEIVALNDSYTEKVLQATDIGEIESLMNEWDTEFTALVEKYADEDLTDADEKRLNESVDRLTQAMDTRSDQLIEAMNPEEGVEETAE